MKFRFTFTTSSGNEKILQDDPRGFRWGNKDINPRRAFSQVNVVWEYNQVYLRSTYLLENFFLKASTTEYTFAS